MELTMWIEKENTLYVNTDAVTKMTGNIKKDLANLKRPLMDRINESAYKDRILEAIESHPGCLVSEFF